MEERLMAEYIGKDAEKIMGANTNWSAAIWGQSIGPVWFFYRKSYLVGVLFIIATFIIGSIASSLGIDKAYYIMFFIYLFTANKLYLWDVRRKVNKIMSSGYMSEEQLIATAREKGGTSIITTVIYVVCLIAFMAIYFIAIFSTMSALMSM